MDESEYKEYLCKKMKNVSSMNNSKRKKRVCRYRGFGAKRGLNLRVKLKRFWARARITRWLKLRLNCLSQALKSLFSNVTTITTRDPSTSNISNKSAYKYNYNNYHHQYSFARSNSFYAEAIADCLEFIKRSSSNNHHHHHFHDQQRPNQSLL